MTPFRSFTCLIGATVLLFIDPNLPFVTANQNDLIPKGLRAPKVSRSLVERTRISIRDLISNMVKTYFCGEPNKPPTQSPTSVTDFQGLSPEEAAANLDAYERLKFPVAFRDFDRAVLEGYQDCDVLLDDVEEALQHLVNSLVKYYLNIHTGTGFMEPLVVMETLQVTEITTSDITVDSLLTATDVGSTEDSFGTNNQHQGVDEADIVKSDGTFVYAVYGSEIIVLDVNGNELFRLQVGEDEDDDYFYYGPIMVFKDDPKKSGEEKKKKEDNPTSDQKSRRTTNVNHRSRPIAGLLLDGDKLVAITTSFHRFFAVTSAETELVMIDINLTNGALNITERKTFPGTYKTARMIESNAHVVTSSYIEKRNFERKFNRFNEEYDGLNGTEYAKVAYEKAAIEIPSFAARIVQDLITSEDDCDHIAKLSSFQNGLELDEDLSQRELLNSLVSVISFHIPSGLNNTANVSASFTPNSNMDIYATSDMIFLGARGWAATTDNSITDVTYVTAFELSGATAIPNATGIIPGYTLNQFSFDYYNGYLRVATSTSAVGSWNSSTFETLRNATNQIVVAQIDDDEIKIVGQLENLGETERIYAVRFLGDRAFMVTFRQIDPFYTIDLSVPQNPVMRGELKIPGFSNYLHPVEEDFILAVGQDANENGELLGLQIAVFDVSNMSDPQQVAKHVIDGWSFSESQHDHFAFRYLPQTEKLILPVSNSTFDGFKVFDITTGTNASIDLHFVVSHFNRVIQGPMCFGGHHLKPRSLVFQGDMMTLKGHSILGHDLDTGTELYRLDLDEDDEDESICFTWFF